MAHQNIFALLVDDENDDPSALFERAGAVQPAPAKELKKTSAPVSNLPTKPIPLAQAVKESQGDGGRGQGGQGGRPGGRGVFGNRDNRFSEAVYNRPPREGGFQGNEQNDRSFNNSREGYSTGSTRLNIEAPVGGEESGRGNDASGRSRGRGRGRGRGYGFSSDGEDRFRQREYDRRSGTGRGNEMKREGAGRGNWGVEVDPQSVLDNVEVVAEEEKPEVLEKKVDDVQPEGESTEKPAEVEEEDKEMTLEEYEKVLSEKRKNLEGLKAKERKVIADKEFASMQLIEKKNEEDIFLKAGAADKGKKKETAEKDDRSKKPVSINEFLRPADGEGYFSPSGRRGGRGGRGGRGERGERGGFRSGFGGGYGARETAPSIEDPSHFPTLGRK